MSGADPVRFMAPFGLNLPNRLDDISGLTSELRDLVSSGQLDLSQGFADSLPTVSVPDRGSRFNTGRGPGIGRGSRAARRLPRGATPGINPKGGDGRIGLPARGTRGRIFRGGRGRRHMPRGRRPLGPRHKRANAHRISRRQQLAKAVRRSRPTPRVRAVQRRTTPSRPSRPSNFRISAPSSNRRLIRHRPSRPSRRVNPVIRQPRVRPIPMGVRRAESARTPQRRPPHHRFIGGVNRAISI